MPVEYYCPLTWQDGFLPCKEGKCKLYKDQGRLCQLEVDSHKVEAITRWFIVFLEAECRRRDLNALEDGEPVVRVRSLLSILFDMMSSADVQVQDDQPQKREVKRATRQKTAGPRTVRRHTR